MFQNEKMPVQAIKTRCLNSLKIDIFLKWLTPGFGPKMAIFPTFFFQARQTRKISFTIFQNKKMPFQAIKKGSSKSRKIDIFLKRLTHGLGPKMAIFPTFFFQAIQNRKMSFTIFQNEKMPFQAIKTRSLNSLKIDIFPKGLTHGFGPKMAIFSTFFFQARQTSKMSFMIFQNEKMSFQTISSRSSKSRKIDIFVRGLTHGFGTKMAMFQTFFFRQDRPGKCLLPYSRTKKCLSRL